MTVFVLCFFNRLCFLLCYRFFRLWLSNWCWLSNRFLNFRYRSWLGGSFDYRLWLRLWNFFFRDFLCFRYRLFLHFYRWWRSLLFLNDWLWFFQPSALVLSWQQAQV